MKGRKGEKKERERNKEENRGGREAVDENPVGKPFLSALGGRAAEEPAWRVRASLSL